MESLDLAFQLKNGQQYRKANRSNRSNTELKISKFQLTPTYH